MPAPFGRLLTAMVTPMHDVGALDLDGAVKLASHLVDSCAHDGLVINGTTGESPTTTDAEKAELLAAVVEAVGDRAHIIAGVGTPDTRHTLELAEQATAAGADGLLVVTPYYSRPTPAGILAHFTAVADAAALPIMVYDIPHRAGVPIPTATLIELGAHPRIVAVKDAKGDPVASSAVVAATDLAYYAGDDAMTLPLLAVGGVGVVGTSTHFTGSLTADLIDAYDRGDTAEALRLHRLLLPVYTGVFAAPGVSMVKAAMRAVGRGAGPVRSPMVDPDPDQLEEFLRRLLAAGL